MTSYIRCPSCAFCIGPYYEFVDHARQSLYKKLPNNDPEKFVFNNLTPSLEPIFEAIGIKNRCCRMHLLSRTEFDRIYK